MPPETITRAEFDTRLAQSTELMRHKRLTLELQTAELETLIGQYSAVLERLEAEQAQSEDAYSQRQNDLRHLLTELAERTSAVAASL